MDVEAELKELKRRVSDLEGAVNVLAGQMRTIQPQLEAFMSSAGKRFDDAERQMDRIVSRLDTVNTQVWCLRDDLPHLIRDALAGHTSKRSGPAN